MIVPQRFQAQLDRCCRNNNPVRPLSGIEKWRKEQAEAQQTWKELGEIKLVMAR